MRSLDDLSGVKALKDHISLALDDIETSMFAMMGKKPIGKPPSDDNRMLSNVNLYILRTLGASSSSIAYALPEARNMKERQIDNALGPLRTMLHDPVTFIKHGLKR